MAVAIALHLLAAVYWVGGMLVMLLAVRPAAVELLEPPLRLPLLCGALSRFFRGVWLSLVVLLATGLWMLFVVFGGFAHSGWHIHEFVTGQAAQVPSQWLGSPSCWDPVFVVLVQLANTHRSQRRRQDLGWQHAILRDADEHGVTR